MLPSDTHQVHLLTTTIQTEICASSSTHQVGDLSYMYHTSCPRWDVKAFCKIKLQSRIGFQPLLLLSLVLVTVQLHALDSFLMLHNPFLLSVARAIYWMSFSLPALPYDYGALEPHMDAMTVNLHHTKHHQTYITKLNEAVTGDEELSATSLTDLQAGAGYSGLPVRNNAGGHYNHCLYWKNMAPIGTCNTAPHGELATKIDATWGSIEAFKQAFVQAAVTRFASGWAFLGVKTDAEKSLVVLNNPNHDNPLMETVSDVQAIPILTCDVWEHAYYLKYQNRRPEFVEGWWQLINWDNVVENYENFGKLGKPVELS